MIITEYKPPSDDLIELSNKLQSLPTPLFRIGEIVAVPNDKGKPIFAVVSLICALGDAYPGEIVYGVLCENNRIGIAYKPESLLVKRGI